MDLSKRDGYSYETYENEPTLAHGLAGGFGRVPFMVGMMLIDEIALVSEAEMVRGIAALIDSDQILSEASGVAGIAAALAGRINGARKCVCVLTGGNHRHGDTENDFEFSCPLNEKSSDVVRNYSLLVTRYSMPFVLVFLISFSLSLLLTPLAAKLGLHLNMADEPSGRRKHAGRIARTGGIAILASFLVGVLITTRLDLPRSDPNEFTRIGVI